jgi:phosphomannomutase
MRSSLSTTDGWRGLPSVGFGEAHLLAALDHAAASGTLSGSVLIGYDGRAGARELAHLAADLLTTHSLSCVLRTGAAPTPAIPTRLAALAPERGHHRHRQPQSTGISRRQTSGRPGPRHPVARAL